MSFEELLCLEGFCDADVLVECRDIKHQIKGIYIADTKNFYENVSYGDLVFYNGVCDGGDENSVTDMIQCLMKKGACGLVVAVGLYIQQVPDKAVQLARSGGFPLIMLKNDGSLSKVISQSYFLLYKNQKRIKSTDHLMRELLYGDEEKALMLLCKENYVRTRQHMVIFLGFDQPGYTREMIENLSYAVPVNLAPNLFSVYYADEDGVIVVLELSQREPIKHIVTRIMSAVQKSLELELNGNNVSAGVSSIFYEPERMRACIEESKNAFQVLRGCKVHHQARYFEEIGIYRFFFEFNNDLELQEVVMRYLGELIQYDEDNNTDYVNTLEVYLDENCNIGITAEKMFLHRNTIKYRVERIQEILGVDLSNVNVGFNLRFAYKIRKYLGGKF